MPDDIPEIVGAEHRARANGLLVTARSLAMIAGFSSAGVVVAQLGYAAAFVLDAGTFLVSATVLTLLPIRTRARSGKREGTGENKPSAGRRSFRLMWAAAPVLMAMIALRAVDGLGSSSHNVALPVYSSLLDPDHPATFISQFWAIWAVGNCISSPSRCWPGTPAGAAAPWVSGPSRSARASCRERSSSCSAVCRPG
ncbi:hypothetical protein SMICM304S_12204 [Streptomyces microflavus]